MLHQSIPNQCPNHPSPFGRHLEYSTHLFYGLRLQEGGVVECGRFYEYLCTAGALAGAAMAQGVPEQGVTESHDTDHLVLTPVPGKYKG